MLSTTMVGGLCLRAIDSLLGCSRAVENARAARDRDLELAQTRHEVGASFAAQSLRWPEQARARSTSAGR